jgi:hypothetical protein
MRFIFKR